MKYKIKSKTLLQQPYVSLCIVSFSLSRMCSIDLTCRLAAKHCCRQEADTNVNDVFKIHFSKTSQLTEVHPFNPLFIFRY